MMYYQVEIQLRKNQYSLFYKFIYLSHLTRVAHTSGARVTRLGISRLNNFFDRVYILCMDVISTKQQLCLDVTLNGYC